MFRKFWKRGSTNGHSKSDKVYLSDIGRYVERAILRLELEATADLAHNLILENTRLGFAKRTFNIYGVSIKMGVATNGVQSWVTDDYGASIPSLWQAKLAVVKSVYAGLA